MIFKCSNEKRSVSPSKSNNTQNTSKYCPVGSFVCRTIHACISSDLVCNHQYDCPDGTDESTCDYFINAKMQEQYKQLKKHEEEKLKKEEKIQECGPEEIKCPNTLPIRCIHYNSLCDNVDDCEDGFDEINCVGESRDEERKLITIKPESVLEDNNNCSPDSFRCRDGSCIDITRRCDRKYDCLLDGSDETDCSYFREAEERRRHEAEEKRRLAEWNEIQHRQKAEEEKARRIKECRQREGFNCPGQNKCIEREKVCNGRSDCANGDDEKNCPVSEEEEGWFYFNFLIFFFFILIFAINFNNLLNI